MRASSVVGYVAGVILVLSSLAHALMGWPAFRDPLAATGIAPELVSGLAIGWYFGSVSMFVFGLIVLAYAASGPGRARWSLLPMWLIATAYVAFGVAACALRGFRPHFLLFVVTGALVGTSAALARRGKSAA